MKAAVAGQKSAKPFLAVLIILLLIGISAAVYGNQYRYSSYICKGVSIAGVDLSKQKAPEAKQAISQICRQLQTKQLVLTDGVKEHRYKLSELGITFKPEANLKMAMAVGREGSFWLRITEIYNTSMHGKTMPLVYQADEKRLNLLVQAIAKEVNRKPANARFNVNSDNSINIISEVNGREVLAQGTIKAIKNCLGEYWRGQTVTVKAVERIPEVTATELSRLTINQLISSFATAFNPEKENRTHNIRVATEAINGIVIRPGETISFNAAVGPRKVAYGYKPAPIIVDKELVEGLGGGVCQVSSTLYNAVLLANLQVIERHGHSLPVPYVPKGRDATVNFGSTDFRFRNNTDHHLLLYGKVSGSFITIKIFGRGSTEKVKIITQEEKIVQPEVEIIRDNSLPTGYEEIINVSKPGYIVDVWRIIEKDGKEIKREHVSNTRYAPEKGIVKIGTS